MYGVPEDLELAPALGQIATQLRVGQFDLQFTLGPVEFLATSSVTLHRGGDLVASWTAGTWPESEFFDLLNTELVRWAVERGRIIVLVFANELELRLVDDSDEFECVEIRIGERSWII